MRFRSRAEGRTPRLGFVCGALVLALAGSGCKGRLCEPGAEECRGDVRRHCTQYGNEGNFWEVWQETPCAPRSCKQVGTRALCVAAPEPDPACAPDGPGLRCGQDAAVIRCELGHRVETVKTCGSAALCAKSLEVYASPPLRPEPFCVLGTEPDPLCAPAPHLAFYVPSGCDGSKQVTCWNGFRVDERDCGEGLCYTSPAHRQISSRQRTAGCVVSRQPDARCRDARLVVRSYDDGHFAEGCDDQGNFFRCLDGLLQTLTPCPHGCNRDVPVCRLGPL